MSQQSFSPPSLDPVAAARHIRHPDQPASWLHDEIAKRMHARLEWIKLKPQVWAHHQPVHGGLLAHELISQTYPQALAYLTETQPERLIYLQKRLRKPLWSKERWTRPKHRFGPPPEATVDMLWSNMLLHFVDNPLAIFQEWLTSLKPQGFVMFSCLGPNTFKELRSLYQSQGWSPPAQDFTDMHDWGDMLVHAGFAEPVMDMEQIRLSWGDASQLLKDLRDLGGNCHRHRFSGMRGKVWMRQLKTHLEKACRNECDGRLTLTLEVVYGHAFKPLCQSQNSTELRVSLDEMKRLLTNRK